MIRSSSFIFAVIIILVSNTDASTLSDLNSLNPQIPSTSNPQPSSPSEFFTSPPNQLDPFQSTDGGEIRPNYNGADWNRRDPMFNVINPKSSLSDDWFPSINSSNNSGSYNTSNKASNNTSSTSSTPNNREFIHKVSVINANNFYTAASPYRRDLKLLSLAYNLLSATSRELNILHLGSGTGYVPLALAVLGRFDCKIVSLDDQSSSSSIANENILKDGKGHFLRNISFSTVENIPNSPINRPPNGKSFDLIVLSKSVPRNFTFPNTIVSVMNPRGFLIYPEDGKIIKMDRLDGNDRMINIKTL